MHVFLYACVHIYIYTYTHIHIYTYIHIYICTYVHIFVYSYTNIYIYTYNHIYIYAYIHIYIYTFYTYIHIYIYTYIHIHMHIHIYNIHILLACFTDLLTYLLAQDPQAHMQLIVVDIAVQVSTGITSSSSGFNAWTPKPLRRLRGVPRACPLGGRRRQVGSCGRFMVSEYGEKLGLRSCRICRMFQCSRSGRTLMDNVSLARVARSHGFCRCGGSCTRYIDMNHTPRRLPCHAYVVEDTVALLALTIGLISSSDHI